MMSTKSRSTPDLDGSIPDAALTNKIKIRGSFESLAANKVAELQDLLGGVPPTMAHSMTNTTPTSNLLEGTTLSSQSKQRDFKSLAASNISELQGMLGGVAPIMPRSQMNTVPPPGSIPPTRDTLSQTGTLTRDFKSLAANNIAELQGMLGGVAPTIPRSHMNTMPRPGSIPSARSMPSQTRTPTRDFKSLAANNMAELQGMLGGIPPSTMSRTGTNNLNTMSMASSISNPLRRNNPTDTQSMLGSTSGGRGMRGMTPTTSIDAHTNESKDDYNSSTRGGNLQK